MEADNEFVDQIAIQMHSFHSDDDDVKWSKQSGKYRAQMRRDVRDALSALDRLGYAVEKRRALAAKDAEIERLRSEVEQCAVEIEEAANVFEGRGFQGLAKIYRMAMDRARASLKEKADA